MKNIKELFIILLLFIVIIFAFGILFYDSLSSKNGEISSVEYMQTDETKAVLEEIQEKSGVDIQEETQDTLLKSYSINKEDLNMYANDNNYESGKKDPFAEESETVEEFTTTSTTNAEKTKVEINNYVSEKSEEKKQDSKDFKTETPKDKDNNNTSKTENKIERKEESIGTFFENKSSK